MGKENTKKDTPEVENKELPPAKKQEKQPEIGGRGGLDPSRFGDWEIAGKCVDF